MKEKDIKHENGRYWVGHTGKGVYTVFKTGVTHSEGDSAYDDLSLAIARCDYLAERAEQRLTEFLKASSNGALVPVTIEVKP